MTEKETPRVSFEDGCLVIQLEERFGGGKVTVEVPPELADRMAHLDDHMQRHLVSLMNQLIEVFLASTNAPDGFLCDIARTMDEAVEKAARQLEFVHVILASVYAYGPVESDASEGGAFVFWPSGPFGIFARSEDSVI